ncbi:MAG: tRNA threonylcarbamoyladenosine dehydratase [Erysipelotrichaceae bacterium]|jgi:tRNA A37 threonylcarbamoyladenosine dehydratase|nr:tRNA threonylcarbamoyladenosine dehydratase [Bacillota bacterium]MDY0118042.1 tRNA threonylcarbamoyladenosine dehydratase [Bacilli bacterium]NLJ32756.1 tRNA threonylcarbamoyladenosine dehydratase [Erysipelotrichaceae bacterium]HOF65230.1 tRNA threonylcarbamoyladenosine dehydratase [Bacilli bacterium]HPK86208.1 tRNA threonylcarbamoyladenosine dehydratase [Bacilli bacterium]
MRYARILPLIGNKGLEKIQKSHVTIFGIGGVGGTAALALARMGIGKISIYDFDVVEETNLNRQVVADITTIGKMKVDVLESKIQEINPNCTVFKYSKKVTIEDIEMIEVGECDFYIDALDDVNVKVALIKRAYFDKIPLISSMGAGNRFDPTKVLISDIFKTEGDPLAKLIRSELRKLGVKKQVVVWSKEDPIKNTTRTPSSSVFVPNSFGLALAYFVIKQLLD